MNILVLGSTGLLGNMVTRYLSRTHTSTIHILDSMLRWPSPEFKDAIIRLEPDVIVNCVGQIPQKTTLFNINYEVPVWLDSLNIRVIHPDTDCEADASGYGISKQIAREFILSEAKNTKIIKTSIIGPEVNRSYSLFGWLLSQTEHSTISGFTNQFWNGNTTLTWARICSDMIQHWNEFNRETCISTTCISKYELLCTIRDVFEKNIKILPTEGKEVNRCIQGISMQPIVTQLYELKRFMNESH